jgi:hypothetical protein
VVVLETAMVLAVLRDGNGGSGVVIIKIPNTHSAIFTGATFGNNSPDFNNSQPITSVAGFNIYVVSQATAATVAFYENFSADFLVIAGGGGGGAQRGGGGGAGGYRCSVTGESSGGGASAESPLTLNFGTPLTVTVGAGGPGNTGTGQGTDGNSSVFSTVTSTGGGGGSGNSTTGGRTGGSGGGQIATTQQTRGLEPQTKDSQEAKQKLVVIVRLEEGAALVR